MRKRRTKLGLAAFKPLPHKFFSEAGSKAGEVLNEACLLNSKVMRAEELRSKEKREVKAKA